MRGDLLEAQATVDWAVAQIPIIRENSFAWQRANPYEFTVEDDPKTGDRVVYAIEKIPYPLMLSVGVGSIIHSVRASLDLLAAALAQRNGEVPSRNTHFPIYKTAIGASDPKGGLDSVKCKQWLSDIERAKIKALQPYGGGDAVLWSLSELDILSKHQRIVRANGEIVSAHIRMNAAGPRPVIRMDQKTELARLPVGDSFRPHHGNTLLAVDVSIDEPRFGVNNESARPLLIRFALRVREIIGMFDVP
jgi:hypothetical protein